MNFKKIHDTIVSFLFTKRCRYCNTVCDIRDDACPECADSVCEIEGEICYNCGCSKLLCNNKERKHYYKSLCAPYYYEGAAKKAVLHLKKHNTPVITEGLCADMLTCFYKHYGEMEFDCCTYVPVHHTDEKERGFNQSQLLAEAIARELQIPCYPLLSKDFKTESQHKLPQMLRSGNLLGAISFNKKCDADITDMRILLVDDIKTTGATLDECAKTLLFESCAEVRCIVACINKPYTREASDEENDVF